MARMAKGGTTIIYGYTLPARGKTNDRTYLNMFYNINREEIENQVKKFNRGIPEESQLTGKEWLERQVIKAKRNGEKGLKNIFTNLVTNKLAVKTSHFVNNFIKGLSEHWKDEWNAFMEVLKSEGESFDPTKFRYTGDGAYSYITNKFTPITISFRNSPERVDIYVKGERIS